jgi:glyoxylase-like metal-dependent hydrolase (beta-lactamase superfamily II)
MTLQNIDALHGLWMLRGGTNGYLIVRGDQALMIDCPGGEAAALLRQAGLPGPERILHTQVQEEHCREWDAFPGVPVGVNADAREVALRTPEFFRAAETRWPVDRDWSTLGEEPYGIAGCMTERPPLRPLNVTSTFGVGETLRWRDIALQVMPLPASGKRSVGFYWQEAGLVFTGDLIHAGGRLVNFYDLERSYGGMSLPRIKGVLESVRALGASRLLPSTGPTIDSPDADIAHLFTLLRRPGLAARRRGGTPRRNLNFEPLRIFGRYRELSAGIVQSANFGNIVLYVDQQGRGLMVDPCNCVWDTWEPSLASMQGDLDLIERETGLRRVEQVLLTHAHGDHVQYANLLRERYGSRILATPDVAAMLADPGRYPYPCMLDWYDFPFDTLRVDARLAYDRVFHWHDTRITPVHTPGHCYAHAGFLVEWRGLRTFCAGDALQYGDGAITGGLPACYNDGGLPDRSPAVSYRRMAALDLDLVMTAHSHGFRDPDRSILRDLAAVWTEQEQALAAFVPDGDLIRATTPPGYDALRPALEDSSTTADSK